MFRGVFLIAALHLSTVWGQFGDAAEPVEVHRFYPLSGTVGQEITVEGRGFSPHGTFISFGKSVSIMVNDLQAGGNVLRVRVPSHARSGRLEVRVGLKLVHSAQRFRLHRFSLSHFFPDSLKSGELLQIRGSGFSLLPRGNRILFENYLGNSYPEEVDNLGSLIKVRIPEGARTGYFSISSRGLTLTSQRKVVIIQPPSKRD
ncbi:MAG: IPT/TIG domain-containing protein [Cytophagales bacterium]|nr:IPT/TIG domain-containing protein [Cytophagales bacterium]